MPPMMSPTVISQPECILDKLIPLVKAQIRQTLEIASGTGEVLPACTSTGPMMPRPFPRCKWWEAPDSRPAVRFRRAPPRNLVRAPKEAQLPHASRSGERPVGVSFAERGLTWPGEGCYYHSMRVSANKAPQRKPHRPPIAWAGRFQCNEAI